jgi:hypothetical protein
MGLYERLLKERLEEERRRRGSLPKVCGLDNSPDLSLDISRIGTHCLQYHHHRCHRYHQKARVPIKVCVIRREEWYVYKP